MKIEKLAANLCEIANGIDLENSSYVANWSGESIYESHSVWGKLWSWFYTVIDLLTLDKKGASKLEIALKKTHEAFQKELVPLEDHLNRYRRHLQLSFEEFPVVAKDIYKTKQYLSYWNDRIYPCIDFSNQLMEKVNDLFQKTLSKPLILTPADDDLVWIATDYQSIIDLEETAPQSFPYGALKRLSQGSTLSERHSSALDRWIVRLNRADHPINLRQFHQALRAFVFALGDPGVDVAKMESLLIKRGCKIFSSPDPIHLSWRESLKPGMEVYCGDKYHTLDSKIALKVEEKGLMMFSLVDEPHLSLVVPPNQAFLGLRRFKDEQSGWAISLPKVFSVDTLGRFQIEESVNRTIDQYAWNSWERWDLSEKKSLDGIGLMLQRFVNEKQTPLAFDPEKFRWNDAGILRTLEPLEKGPFDYLAIEKFILEVSAGNEFVLTHLLNLSGIYRHSIGAFYQKILIEAIKGNHLSAAKEGQSYGIKDQNVINEAVEKRIRILEIKKEIIAHLNEFFDLTPVEKKGLDAVFVQLWSDVLVTCPPMILLGTRYEGIAHLGLLNGFIDAGRFKMKESHFLKYVEGFKDIYRKDPHCCDTNILFNEVGIYNEEQLKLAKKLVMSL